MARVAALLVGICLLAGCDGGLKIEGQLLTADARPAANVPIYFYRNGEPDEYDPVLWSDAAGRFELDRLDCPCEFTLELLAIDPILGMGRVLTRHEVLEKNPKVVIRMAPLATRESPQSVGNERPQTQANHSAESTNQ